VKWTQPGIVLSTSLLQLDVVSEDADEVHLLLEGVFEVRGLGHVSSNSKRKTYKGSIGRAS